MTELVLNANTLPEPLSRLFKTEMVMAREENGVVSLMPITVDCPLRGLAASSGLTVDKFLAMKRAEKELES